MSYSRPPRSVQAARAYGGTTEDALAFAAEAFGDEPPRAVVAVAEGAVPAAAALRARYGLPGLSEEAAARCHDKALMKTAVLRAQIPCAAGRVADASTTPEALVRDFGLPLVLKTPVSSGGRGVRIVTSIEEVRSCLKPGLLVESFVDGMEMSVETLTDWGRVVFRNQTRYLVVRWANIVPASLSSAVASQVDELADRVLSALDVSHGISHMELFVTKDGPIFSEIAARPPGGRLMELMGRAYDFDPWEALIRIELGDSPETLPRAARRYCGVWFLHPGPGIVASVAGLDEARAIEGITKVRCAVEPGDEISERLGSGQSVGEIDCEGRTDSECEARLRHAHSKVRIALR